MKVAWTTIASLVRRIYVTEDGKCKLCGEKLISLEDKKGYTILSKIYRHFMFNHPEVIEELKRLEGTS